jgi:hypothetical protein
MTGDQPGRGQVGQTRPLDLWPTEPSTPPGSASDVAQLNEIALRFFRSRLATRACFLDHGRGRVARS